MSTHLGTSSGVALACLALASARPQEPVPVEPERPEEPRLELAEEGAATYVLELAPVHESGEEPEPVPETDAEAVVAILGERVRDLGFRSTGVERTPDGRIEVRVEPAPVAAADETVLDLLTGVGALELRAVAPRGSKPETGTFDELPERTGPDTLVVLRPASPEDTFGNDDLGRVDSAIDGFGRPAFAFEMAPEHRQRFGRFTGRLQGERLAVVVDGVVHIAPWINEPLLGSVMISGGGDGYAPEEVLVLGSLLGSSSLPVPLRHVETRRDE